MSFTPLPLPAKPTTPATGATYYTDWQPYFAEVDAVSRENQALATAYAADQFLQAQNVPQTYSLDANILGVLQQMATALDTLGKAMTTRIVSSTTALTIFGPWNLSAISLVPGGTFDLKTTLPTGIPTGGTFAVAAASLPQGVTLAPDTGVLSVDPAASTASVSGLQFSYTV